MALTGRADGPALAAPARIVAVLEAVGAQIAVSSARWGDAVELDALALLGERAAISGFTRQGDRSCGGGTRLVRAADGWVAASLARADDVASVPAWLEVDDIWADEVWKVVTEESLGRSVASLVERARLLGLPVSKLPSEPLCPDVGPFGDYPVAAQPVGDADRVPSLHDLVVVDLSSLWAGPLCTNVLQLAGARVVKVESTRRPDGARAGPPAFFDLLNSGKEHVAFDFATPEGRAALRHLLTTADVVVEASRPRALGQLGIDRDEVLAAIEGPRIWLSITGYGRTGPDADGVAFGDDAAVAGGLVAWDEQGPCFCADAIADPAAGMVAAVSTLTALETEQRWTLDVAMRDVAAHLATGEVPETPARLEVAPPRARLFRVCIDP
jgi:hypothetical protein